ncbi:hypothetical protein [Sorangium sp. So ce1389]|uniref:hypothetical protein n=1 Tax=Sorangium sp. So ce1389 TaxID=3133336 RepID=UPI003F612F5A
MSTTEPAVPLCRYHEIVVHIAPFSTTAQSVAPDAGESQRYHAWIYTNLSLPVKVGDVDTSAESGAAPPPEIGGLPLIGHEEIAVTWPRYDEYLWAFHGGERALLPVWGRIFRQLSGGLRALLLLKPQASHRLRIWWSIDAPGLEDLPWERIWLRRYRPWKFSMVRGSPGRSAPPLPLSPGQPLRVAVIDPASGAPDALWEALTDLGSGIEVVPIEQDDPHKAISEAIRAEVEVVHVVADGVAPLELEGLLEFSGKRLSPKELAGMVRGSRITIVSLTPPEEPRIGRLGVPTVFRAFARFGHDSGEGPTIASQLGPMPRLAFRHFWRAFYERLAEALDVEDALMCAARRPLIMPVVLFLRHRFGRQFSRQGEGMRRSPTWPTHGSSQTSADVPLTPAQVLADLSVSRDLLDTLGRLDARYASLGLDFPEKSLVESERRRLADLDEALDQSLSEDPKP